METKQTRLSTAAMGFGMFLVGLFGDALVGDTWRLVLALMGIALILFAVIWPLFLRWQFGPPRTQAPIHFSAITTKTPFEIGADVNGIIWEVGYTYVQLTVQNAESAPLKDLEVILDLGGLCFVKGNIRDGSESGSLSPVGMPLPSIGVAVGVDGAQTSFPITPLEQLTTTYRLNCPTLGVQGRVIVELAIVQPKPTKEALSSDKLYEPIAPDVEAMLVNTTFQLRGEHVQLQGEIPIGLIDVGQIKS